MTEATYTYTRYTESALTSFSYRKISYFFRKIDIIIKEILSTVSKDFVSFRLLEDHLPYHDLVKRIYNRKTRPTLAVYPESFPPLSSLSDLLKVPTPIGEPLKILALDLDEVLITHNSPIASNPWQYATYNSNAHRHIETHFLINTPRIPLEEPSVSQEVIQSYKERGYKVVILTARLQSSLDLTIAELAQCHIPIPKEDIIMIPNNLNRAPKSEVFFKWLQDLPEYTPDKEVFVLFADDRRPYCGDMHSLNAIEGIQVTCFEFTKLGFPRPWNESQLKGALHQYHCYKTGQPIPHLETPIDDTHLQYIKELYKIETLTDETLINLL